MKNYQSGFAPLAIVAVILGVLILGGATYFGARNFPVSQPRPEINPYDYPPLPGDPHYSFSKCDERDQSKCIDLDKQVAADTATWKTYRNEKYGFGFKYPDTWEVCGDNQPRKIREGIEEGVELIMCVTSITASTGNKNHVFITSEETKLATAYPNYAAFSGYYLKLKRDMEENPENYPGAAGHFWIHEKSLGGLPAIEVCSGDSLGVECSVYAYNGKNLIALNYSTVTYPQNRKDVDDVISTFKFIDSISITNPSITSISQSSGPIGTKVELKGYNLVDNRGNQNLIIENSKGEVASFGFGNPEHLKLSEKYVSMKFTLNEKVCKDWATDKGGPCTKGWMTIVPGEYKIYVASNGFTDTSTMSNKVTFTVTTSLNTTPSITFISPASGPTGTVVTLTGNGFTSGSATYIGISESGQKAWSPDFVSPTKLVFNIPAGLTLGIHSVSVFVAAPHTPTSNAVNFNVTSPSITIISPNGGEVWRIGSKQTAKWKMGDIDADWIELSIGPAGVYSGPMSGITNDSASFEVPQTFSGGDQTGFPLNAGSYKFSVTLYKGGVPCRNPFWCTKAEQARSVEVARDESDAPITITSATTQPTITVTSPNGGEIRRTDPSQSLGLLRWSYPVAHNVDIKLLDKNSSARLTIVSGVSAQPYLVNAGNQGATTEWRHLWNNNLNDGRDVPSGMYYMQVCIASTSVCDSSDASFTITRP